MNAIASRKNCERRSKVGHQSIIEKKEVSHLAANACIAFQKKCASVLTVKDDWRKCISERALNRIDYKSKCHWENDQILEIPNFVVLNSILRLT